MRSGPTVNARVGFGLRCGVEHGKTQRVSDKPSMAFVALGGNLGDAAATLREAAAEIAGWSSARALGSSLWRTEPVDCPPGSPSFLNAALGLQPKPGATPESLLDDLLALEARLGRTRSGLANAPPCRIRAPTSVPSSSPRSTRSPPVWCCPVNKKPSPSCWQRLAKREKF